MIQIGNDKIKDIYVGSDKIKEVYYGSEKVWGKIESVGDGYWVHKDTGVITYFDADADFITDGIMSSPSWAADCSEVQIPSGVTGLGFYCFFLCSSLTSINIPEGVTSLGDSCFYGCTSLTSITLPESVTSIESYTFSGCTSLSSVDIPESVTSIGSYTFSGCTSLTLATVLPAVPPSLGGNAFVDVHSSFNIKVRSSYVDDYKAATNWIEYESIISGIQDGYWVHKDTGVKTYFGLSGAMSTPAWKNNAKEIKVPTGVTSLSSSCFANSPDLEILILPSTLLEIGAMAFMETSKMWQLILHAITPPSLDPDLGGYVGDLSRIQVKVPEESVNAYKSAPVWSNFSPLIVAL